MEYDDGDYESNWVNTIPFEYESTDKAICYFYEKISKKRNFKFFGQTFYYREWEYSGGDKVSYHCPRFYTLEEWFEFNKCD